MDDQEEAVVLFSRGTRKWNRMLGPILYKLLCLSLFASSSGSSNGQYVSLAGTYKTTKIACSSSFWADGYSITLSGTNTYVLITNDKYHLVVGNIIQSSDSTFSIYQGSASCSGVKTDARSTMVTCINGCSAIWTSGSGMVVANIFLVVTAVSALLAL
ncbi:hypothetical protein PROFUN_01921 [Planoprotostelium fungivorum]|uniref:Uncharacterized protein n=1 Tax=Planoprotostelium fungivorum TaxID=1890364 RepID=A0A2P6NZ17_9EUKA|nr:hypothetical protein PROFUN_01921 [Planoprotostelium fungivorum]